MHRHVSVAPGVCCSIAVLHGLTGIDIFMAGDFFDRMKRELAQPDEAPGGTMRFGSTTKDPAKHTLKCYRTQEWDSALHAE